MSEACRFKADLAPPSVGECGNAFEALVELHGHRLAAHSQHFQGVFMEAKLGVGNLEAANELFEVLRKGVEVVSLALKGENRGLRSA